MIFWKNHALLPKAYPTLNRDHGACRMPRAVKR
jgi:hypothetical protein